MDTRPTLGSCRDDNITVINIWCCHQPCQHHATIELATLIERFGTRFVFAGLAKKFKCSKCGSKNVQVMPCWPDPIEIHRRRMRDE